MISFPLDKEQAGALTIAVFLLYVVALPNTPELGVIVGFSIAILLIQYATLRPFFHSSQLSEMFDRYRRFKSKKHPAVLVAFLMNLFVQLALVVFYPLLISIVTVTGLFAMEDIAEVDIKENYVRLILAIYSIIWTTTYLFGLPEFLAQTSTRDKKGKPLNTVGRLYLWADKSTRFFICMVFGTFWIGLLISFDAIGKALDLETQITKKATEMAAFFLGFI